MRSEALVVEHVFGEVGGHGVLRLKGPLTTESVSDFQNAVRREKAPTMILDLTDVPYVDSSGLGSLVTAHVSRQKLGQQVALSGVNERISKLFEITKLGELFLVFPTLWDAIEALSSSARA